MRNYKRAFSLAMLAGVAMSATAQAQITNGGFETGNFSGWTQFGNTGFTAVAGTFNLVAPHGGAFAAHFGPTAATGGIQQTVPANSGQNVTIEFWYKADGVDNSFSADLGTTNLYSVVDDLDHTAWTFFTFTVPAPSANPMLAFTLFNPPNYDYLDDISALAGAAFACCLPNGNCTMTNSAGCTAAQGTFHDGETCAQVTCPPPPDGRCCALDGTCTIATQANCIATAGSIWGGANSTCTTCPQPWHETGDALELPADAQAVTGSGAVSAIMGHIDGTDTDMYKIRICDHANFSASTTAAATGNTLDTQLFLFDTAGVGVVMDDDSPAGVGGSVVTGQFVTTDGDYYLAYSLYNRDPQDAAAALIWNNQNNALAYYPEWQPNGPAPTNPVAAWAGTSTVSGDYTIALQGVCYLGGASCYGNCDNSSVAPILNANDFQCFLNAYAAAQSLTPAEQATHYANCDHSAVAPVLNANDFQCFLNAYAVGCS